MNVEILYSVQQLYHIDEFSVDAAQKNYENRAALFSTLWELSVLSHRLFSEFSSDSPIAELKKAGEILGGIHERLKNLAAPALAEKAARLLTAIINADIPAVRTAWRDLLVPLESFNDKIAASRRYRETFKRERFEKFVEAFAGNVDEQVVLARLHELRGDFYTKQIDAILERIEQLLSQHQYAAARIEFQQLVERIAREDAGDNDDVTENANNQPAAPKKILVIDDIPVVLLAVKSLLVPRYHVIAVKDYQTAIKALGGTTVDLILVDINMPGMDGITLVKVIRAMDAYEKTPIIFLTGNSDRESVLAALAAGGNDFVLKPINREVLLQKIEKFLKAL